MNAAVDVVVLTWNDGELLDLAVRSALDSAGADVMVYVVDNGSSPAAVPPDDPRVVLVRNDENRGVAGGRNQGIAMGNAPVVCLLDSDARLEPGALAALVAALGPDVACSGPVFVGQTPEASGGRAPTLGRKLARVAGRTSEYASSAPHDGDDWDVDFVIGACQVFRRDAYDAIGGIDEGYFYGPEDVDFCMRLRAAGWRVVQCSGSPVHHPPRRRHRRVATAAGARHTWAVCRHLWRHRGFERTVRPR